jgi:hypothetical protein
MDYGYPRTWTARITYSEDWTSLCFLTELGDRVGETVDADKSESDLQKSMASAAYGEACSFILAGCAKAAYVQLYKTTKAHGTVRDHTSYMIDVDDAVKWARKTIARRGR